VIKLIQTKAYFDSFCTVFVLLTDLGHVKLSFVFVFNSNKYSIMSPTELRTHCIRIWKFLTTRF